MAKKSCTQEEFEQFEEIYQGFCWLMDKQSATPDSAYKGKQQEVLEKIAGFWPTLKGICNQMDISLRTQLTEGVPPEVRAYAAAMAGKPIPQKTKPRYKTIDLDMMSRVIRGQKPIAGGFPANLVAKHLGHKTTEREYVEEFFHKFRGKLYSQFAKDVATDKGGKSEKPAGTMQDIPPGRCQGGSGSYTRKR